MKSSLFLEQAREKFIENIVISNKIDIQQPVHIVPLTPKESIGEPGRKDFPLMEGKEYVVQAVFGDCKGQAFTDSPCEFIGTLHDILNLPLDTNQYRAVFMAVANAVCFKEKMISQVVHCKNDEPEHCGREIAFYIQNKWGNGDIGLIGYNPAIAENLVRIFNPSHVRITDLNYQNIGSVKYGVEIWDGRTMTEALIKRSRIILLTGTTLVNGTFDLIWNLLQLYQKDYLVYGVTCTAVAEMMGLKRICPFGRSG